MSWQDILKRVDIRNAEEYERASLEDRRRWHNRTKVAYNKRLKALRRTHNITNEESPMYKEMVELQELYRFHERQGRRIERDSPDVYSLELETNRRKNKGRMTPQGNPMPYTELSQDVYETLSDSEKSKYHGGMYRLTDGEEKKFHRRMDSRIKDKSKLPTFAASKEEQNSKEDVNSENLERMAGTVTTTAPAHAKLFKPAYRTRKKRKDE